MKVFISSLISGYELYRAAVAEAVEALGHQVTRAEDFGATAGTPQQACLGAVRDSDLVVLLVGERYGYVQPSRLSATHEEYAEAKERKPVLVFVESVTAREPAQQAFLDEVQAWSTGHFRASFKSSDDLKTGVLRALHEHELATASGVVDEAEMRARALALLGDNDRRLGARLAFAVAGGPYQQVLRPTDIEKPDLARDLQRESMFGDYAVLDSSKATSTKIRQGALLLEQESASLMVNEAGSIRIVQPANTDVSTNRFSAGISALIEEDLTAALVRSIRFAGWLLDRIDPLHRVTDVVPAAQVGGAGYMPWRTRAEHAASPTSATIQSRSDVASVTLTPARKHRQSLVHDAARIAEDLIVLLRREVQE